MMKLTTLFLLKIGFFPVSIWDLLDILIVGYLIFKVFKLLKGSIGFNISVGIASIYMVWWGVQALEMPLLTNILGQFINVGILALLVLFQPELRRFLLLLGQGSMQGRFNFIARWFNFSQDKEAETLNPEKERILRELFRALEQMSETKTGALMLVAYRSGLEGLYSSGIKMNAEISTELIVSIFNKESPLHDGAMIISEQKIIAASCVLPVSERNDIPQKLGLRHRAAIGITEVSNIIALVVSEETGQISYVRNGQITRDIQTEWLHKILIKVV